MSDKPRILKQSLAAQTRIFRVEQLDLEFANGEQRQYERLLGGKKGAVLVVPLLDDDTLLLIREYAAGTDRYELGFPKGKIDGDEDMMDAADRELREEVGYGANKLELLRTATLAPGYIQHRTHLILARELIESRLDGDEPEPIEVVPWKLDQIDRLMVQDDFTEGRSILALLLALRHLSEK